MLKKQADSCELKYGFLLRENLVPTLSLLNWLLLLFCLINSKEILGSWLKWIFGFENLREKVLEGFEKVQKGPFSLLLASHHFLCGHYCLLGVEGKGGWSFCKTMNKQRNN